MPIKCTPCDKYFADSSLAECPDCGNIAVYQFECECEGACEWYCE